MMGDGCWVMDDSNSNGIDVIVEDKADVDYYYYYYRSATTSMLFL